MSPPKNTTIGAWPHDMKKIGCLLIKGAFTHIDVARRIVLSADSAKMREYSFKILLVMRNKA